MSKKSLVLVFSILLFILPSLVFAAAVCGNGAVDSGEQCDGKNLNRKTCQSYGIPAGSLTCNNNCQIDTSNCYVQTIDPPPPRCYSDSDCTSKTSSYCEGTSACTITTKYTCANPGTTSSSCIQSVGSGGCTSCNNGCKDGACITTQNDYTDVVGRLLDYYTKKPLVGAIVYTRSLNGQYLDPIYTDSNGNFEYKYLNSNPPNLIHILPSCNDQLLISFDNQNSRAYYDQKVCKTKRQEFNLAYN